MNVRINTGDYEDKAYVEDILAKSDALKAKAIALEAEIVAVVESKL